MLKSLIGEAEAEGELGQRAICWVMLNRVRKGNFGGSTIADVCLAPYQLECWNQGTQLLYYTRLYAMSAACNQLNSI